MAGDPQIVVVNDEHFRIIKKDGGRLAERPDEVTIGLIRAVESGNTPTHKLTYQYERPNEMEFFSYDSRTKEWRLERIISIHL